MKSAIIRGFEGYSKYNKVEFEGEEYMSLVG
jgi:hypothetical protein